MSQKTNPELAATALRIALAVMLLAHASLKLFVFTPAGTAGLFASIGLPGSLAHAVIAMELAAGIALLVGVYSRIASVAMVPVMIGTIVFVHGANGWAFGNEGGGWEYPAFLTVALLVQALLGDGAYALGRQREPQRAVATA
ncbi:MAG: DoxX family protein [Pseudomonadota bacterium]